MAPQKKKDLSKKTASAKTSSKKSATKMMSGKKTSSSKRTTPTRTPPKKTALISATKKTAVKKDTGAKRISPMEKPLNKKAQLKEKIATKSGAKVKFYFSIENVETEKYLRRRWLESSLQPSRKQRVARRPPRVPMSALQGQPAEAWPRGPSQRKQDWTPPPTSPAF